MSDTLRERIADLLDAWVTTPSVVSPDAMAGQILTLVEAEHQAHWHEFDRIAAKSNALRRELAWTQRRLAEMQCCSDEPCENCVACLRRSVKVACETIAKAEERKQQPHGPKGYLWCEDQVLSPCQGVADLRRDLAQAREDHETTMRQRDQACEQRDTALDGIPP